MDNIKKETYFSDFESLASCNTVDDVEPNAGYISSLQKCEGLDKFPFQSSNEVTLPTVKLEVESDIECIANNSDFSSQTSAVSSSLAKDIVEYTSYGSWPSYSDVKPCDLHVPFSEEESKPERKDCIKDEPSATEHEPVTFIEAFANDSNFGHTVSEHPDFDRDISGPLLDLKRMNDCNSFETESLISPPNGDMSRSIREFTKLKEEHDFAEMADGISVTLMTKEDESYVESCLHNSESETKTIHSIVDDLISRNPELENDIAGEWKYRYSNCDSEMSVISSNGNFTESTGLSLEPNAVDRIAAGDCDRKEKKKKVFKLSPLKLHPRDILTRPSDTDISRLATDGKATCEFSTAGACERRDKNNKGLKVSSMKLSPRVMLIKLSDTDISRWMNCGNPTSHFSKLKQNGSPSSGRNLDDEQLHVEHATEKVMDLKDTSTCDLNNSAVKINQPLNRDLKDFNSSQKVAVKMQTQVIPFRCRDCCKTFKSMRLLARHVRTHRGEESFKCDQCGRSFSSKGNLSVHIRTHKAEKTFKCGQCSRSFSSRVSLFLHIRTHTGEKPFICDYCGKGFCRNDSLSKHIRTHTGEKPFKCDHCDKSFSRKEDLSYHIKEYTEGKPFKCDQCGKSFNKSHRYQIHLRTHTGEKPFKCDHCDKNYKNSDSLRLHKQLHMVRRFNCSQCDRSFHRSAQLNCHMRTHTGEKPYKCGQCDRSFARKHHLSYHLRIHAGEKPFKCNECGKRFRQKVSLSTHFKTHTGERPFRCDECGKRFSQKGSLSTHLKRHTGEKPFRCDECGKRYTEKTSLTTHLKRHTGERPLKCEEHRKGLADE